MATSRGHGSGQPPQQGRRHDCPRVLHHARPLADGSIPSSGYILVINDGKFQAIRTRLVGGPQDGRLDVWFTLAPEDLPEGWAVPRRAPAPEGEVLVEDLYRRRPGQVAAYGGEVLYDFDHTSPAR